MAADPQVGLGDAVRPETPGQVDQQGDLDTPTLDERNLHSGAAPHRVLAAEWLAEMRQLGEELRQQRPRHQLGGATTTGLPVQEPLVVPLDEDDPLVGEQRLRQRGDVVRLEAREVGIAPHDHVGVSCSQALPQGIPLAEALSGLGKHLRGAHDPSTRGLGHLAGPIRGVVVEYQKFVHQLARRSHQLPAHFGADLPDGGLLVQGGEADRDGPTPLEVGEPIGRRARGHRADDSRARWRSGAPLD